MKGTQATSWFRRPGCLAALAVPAILAVGLAVLWDAVRPRCDLVTLDRLPSPTGLWTAIPHESTCDVGLLAMTDIVAGVSLASKEFPLREVDLLGVDTGGHDDERPRLAWSAPNVLQVTVPNLSFLKVLTKHVDGIVVDLRFDPDDPAARRSWRKKNRWEPEPLDHDGNPGMRDHPNLR